MSKKGIVTKSVGGVFNVTDDCGKTTVCFSPKKFRYNDTDVIIGDNVRSDLHKNRKGLISEILPRKNKLNRPEIANVDVCFVVVAYEPQPDLYLVDKVLINCFQQGIGPKVVVNKSDIASGLSDVIRDNYQVVAQIVSVSAFDDTASELEPFFSGKTACFAGQSAVGKTSLINALMPDFRGETGELSAKSGRGMHTTRHASLHKVGNGFLADTCGFSLCDLKDIRSDELRLYLDDMVELSHECRYTSCTHTVEPDCNVKRAVANKLLNADRYARYVEEYNELVEFEKNKY